MFDQNAQNPGKWPVYIFVFGAYNSNGQNG